MTVKQEEIERKWIVPQEKFPYIAGNFSMYNITQFYNEKGERFRMTTDDNNEVCYQKTVKGEGGLVRPETNTDISVEDYQAALVDSSGCLPISKTRFVFHHGEYKIELDKFNTGELYAEIEFDTVEEATAFTDVPDWFGEEVTGDDSHSNYSIWLKMQKPKEKPVEEKKEEGEETPSLSINRLLVTGELTTKSHHDFYDMIRSEHPKSPIILELSTPGGDVVASNMFVEHLEVRNAPTLIVCLDRVQSAGIHLLGAHGSTRLAHLTTSFMYHRVKIGYTEAEVESVAEWSVHATALGKTALDRVAMRAGLTLEEVTMLEPNYDMYFNSFDALEMGAYGLIDGIIIRKINKREFYIWTRDGYKYFHFPYHDVREQPVLSDEEVAKLGLLKITRATKEPSCFIRWKQRNQK